MGCQGAGSGREVGVRARDLGDPGAGQGSGPRGSGPRSRDPGFGVQGRDLGARAQGQDPGFAVWGRDCDLGCGIEIGISGCRGRIGGWGVGLGWGFGFKARITGPGCRAKTASSLCGAGIGGLGCRVGVGVRGLDSGRGAGPGLEAQNPGLQDGDVGVPGARQGSEVSCSGSLRSSGHLWSSLVCRAG